jgi:DNA-binding LacI/PurR family transcriptional regulator
VLPRVLQHYRQELIQDADKAIEKANCFLFLGYGFNDTHLEEYIRRKLITQKSNCLIITRDSNERIENLLKSSDNSWLICKTNDSDGSRIYNKYADWLLLDRKNIWDINEFDKYIFGGS